MRSLKNFNGNNRRGDKPSKRIADEVGMGADYEKYAEMDEDALIAELMKNVRAAKANGTYDPEQMRAFIALASPSLTPAQREKMENVVRLMNADTDE